MQQGGRLSRGQGKVTVPRRGLDLVTETTERETQVCLAGTGQIGLLNDR